MTNQELEARIDATHKAMEAYLGKYLLVEKNPQLTDITYALRAYLKMAYDKGYREGQAEALHGQDKERDR